MKKWFRKSSTTECDRIREMLSPYMDNELDPNEQQEVEEHLQSCQSCQAELDSFKRVSNLVRQLPEINPTRSFTLTEKDIVKKTWDVRLKALSGAAALVAIALILVFIGDVRHLFDAPPLPPPPFSQPPEINKYYWPVRETEIGLLGTFIAIAIYTLLYWLSHRKTR